MWVLFCQKIVKQICTTVIASKFIIHKYWFLCIRIWHITKFYDNSQSIRALLLSVMIYVLLVCFHKYLGHRMYAFSYITLRFHWHFPSKPPKNHNSHHENGKQLHIFDNETIAAFLCINFSYLCFEIFFYKNMCCLFTKDKIGLLV